MICAWNMLENDEMMDDGAGRSYVQHPSASSFVCSIDWIFPADSVFAAGSCETCEAKTPEIELANAPILIERDSISFWTTKFSNLFLMDIQT